MASPEHFRGRAAASAFLVSHACDSGKRDRSGDRAQSDARGDASRAVSGCDRRNFHSSECRGTGSGSGAGLRGRGSNFDYFRHYAFGKHCWKKYSCSQPSEHNRAYCRACDGGGHVRDPDVQPGFAVYRSDAMVAAARSKRVSGDRQCAVGREKFG